MPNKVFVDVDLNLPKKLEKDLQENEVICPVCKGIGLTVYTQPYGLKGEKHPSGLVFPYKYQTLVPCNACYNGIAKVCKNCGKPMDRRKYNCDCEGAEQERTESARKKYRERWEKAKKITLAEAVEKYIYLYVEESDKFLYPDELLEHIEEIQAEEPNLEIQYVYGTTVNKLTLDAGELVNNECERQELHEEASDRINGSDIKELQEFLNKWCDNVSQDTTTYNVDYSVGIMI